MTRELATIFIVGLEGMTKSVIVEKDKIDNFTVSELKKNLLKKTGLEEAHQRLIYGTKELEVKRSGRQLTMGDYNIKNGSTVMLVVRLPGGKAMDRR